MRVVTALSKKSNIRAEMDQNEENCRNDDGRARRRTCLCEFGVRWSDDYFNAAIPPDPEREATTIH